MGKHSSPEHIRSFTFQAIQTFHYFALKIAAERRGEAGNDLLMMAAKELRTQEIKHTWREPELFTQRSPTPFAQNDSRSWEMNR